MSIQNTTQIERYKNLIKFIDEHFKEDIDIEKIEQVSHYSYRNMNRIFQSLQQETIGKHIKRIRLEKAAEYLKYTNQQVSDIALMVGFSDVAAFSKAFKKRFTCSPITFRQTAELHLTNHAQAIGYESKKSIPYIIETLPEFNVLYLEHKGSYNDIEALDKTWNTFMQYCDREKLMSDDSIFYAETLDDNAITDDRQCRTNVAMILAKPLDATPPGLLQTKIHQQQKYAKFMHHGPANKLVNTYDTIYGYWLTSINLELADKPTLEFYTNHHEDIPEENFLTEIYIPVL